MKQQAEITYEDNMYTFVYQDQRGFVVTDGATIEELYSRAKEALDLHYETEEYTINLTLPIRLSFSNKQYAS
jgi:predicted RNase H-like HicB family nuclease